VGEKKTATFRVKTNGKDPIKGKIKLSSTRGGYLEREFTLNPYSITMHKRLSICLSLALLFAVEIAFAQQKRSLTHADYDGWESLSSEQITKDGRYVGYQISPQDGDARLEIFPYANPARR
jgi:hypothetical protein